jgi:hypothetical protein
VAKEIPRQFKLAGYVEMAELFEGNPDEFKRRKQEGERLLIGKTYDEARDEFNRKFFAEHPFRA